MICANSLNLIDELLVQPFAVDASGSRRLQLRINEIVLGKRSITADTDLRLARYFGVSEGFWLGLQADHDLLHSDLARISPYRRAA